MNLYKVINGFRGRGLASVLVVAQNEDKALELAKGKFKENEIEHTEYGVTRSEPRESYWKDLETEVILKDISKEQVSGVIEIV